jgi:hypothetical protein
MLKYCQVINATLSVNNEYLTDTIIQLSVGVIAAPSFQSFGLGVIPGFWSRG